CTIVRETHDADLEPGQTTKVQRSYSYSHGFGREIQKKVQAEPGPVVEDGPDVSPRWVGSGWTVFNNKGKPVKKYEPFFSPTRGFEFGRSVGVSVTLLYDPVGRVVATLHPNHTWEKVVFDPWQQESWDVNDTVRVLDPRDDPDVGALFGRLAEDEFLPTWHAQRIGGVLGDVERQAAGKAAAHAETPALSFFDMLGRPFMTVAHNRFRRDGATVEEKYATRVELDIEGNQREVVDALGRIVMRYDYDMLGTRVHQASMEAGERWMLPDVAGNPIRRWDAVKATRTEYDELRRPTHLYLSDDDGTAVPASEQLVERTVYGEDHPEKDERNLRGKPCLQLDGAGLVASERFDFKGNLLEGSRRLAREYRNTVDWVAVDGLDDPTAILAAVEPQLEGARLATLTRYDALNRPIQLVSPHG
ncbi:MAG: SpvB/TcaC N-terminal domain-containing protein, partial [Acidimicrobiales bacterium]